MAGGVWAVFFVFLLHAFCIPDSSDHQLASYSGVTVSDARQYKKYNAHHYKKYKRPLSLSNHGAWGEADRKRLK